MKNWYLETSAINHLMDELSIDDAIATKTHQAIKGRRWVISPVCIWEILSTSDPIRREKLIFFSQHLFHRELLPGPAELTLHFMFQGCPRIEKRRPLLSRSPLSEVWRNLVDCTAKTFLYEPTELTHTLKVFQEMSRTVHRISRGEGVNFFDDSKESETRNTLDSTLHILDEVVDLPKDERSRKIQRIALYYLITLACAGGVSERAIVDAMWKQQGVAEPKDRITYAIRNYPQALLRGPLVMLATMSFVQAAHKFSRGVLFDSLHAIYATYCDLLLTNDRDFLSFRDGIGGFTPAFKICHLDELSLVYHPRTPQWVADPFIP